MASLSAAAVVAAPSPPASLVSLADPAAVVALEVSPPPSSPPQAAANKLMANNAPTARTDRCLTSRTLIPTFLHGSPTPTGRYGESCGNVPSRLFPLIDIR
ncbi:MAG: hypothetical protein R2755_30495 [Acidimicrobiales bacterium]